MLPKWVKRLLRPFANAYRYLITACQDIKHFIRARKAIVKIIGREWTTNLDILDLVITYDCNLKCVGCNLACGIAQSKEFISLEQVKRFIKEWEVKNKKWKLIIILGGEPLIHPDVLKICSCLLEYKENFSKRTTIKLFTNSYGDFVNSMKLKIPPGIQIESSNKVSRINKNFLCFTNAPIDKPEYKSADFSCGCRRTARCGISLNMYGYYPCAVSGAIDRVFGFNKGRKELPDKPDAQMIKDLELFCRYCGGFLYSNYRKVPAGFTSKTWAEKLETYQKNKPKLTPY